MTADPRGEKALSVRWLEIGRAVDEVGLAMTGHRSLSVDVVGLSVRGPQGPGGDFLITVRGLDEDGQAVVAFHGASDLAECLRGLSNRLLNGSLKWRSDQFGR